MMKITHSLSVDLQHSGSQNTIYAKQGDRLTREVTINLFNGGSVWAAPSEVAVLQLAYCKSDKVGGCYDHMPDASVAGRFNSDRTAVTLQLHPQVLNVAGNVFCELRLLTNAGEILNTFNFIINCQKSPIAMTSASEGYYNNVFDGATFIPHISPDGTVSWTNNKNLPNPAPVNVKGPKGDPGQPGPKGDPGETAPDAVKYTEQNLTDEQKAQARANIGVAGMEAVEAAAEAVNTAAQAVQAVAEAVDVIPDWAKQPEKPVYYAYDIQFFNKSWPSRPMDVGEALNDLQANKLDKPEVLTWNQEEEQDLIDFLRTIYRPGRYTFEDSQKHYEYELRYVDKPGEGICYYGELKIYDASDGSMEEKVFVGNQIEDLERQEWLEPSNKSYIGSRRKTFSITLFSDAWTEADNGLTQTISGISALSQINQTDDVLLQCCAAPQSVSAWSVYGIRCMDAAAGTMTFHADTAPAENENISVIVAMWR